MTGKLQNAIDHCRVNGLIGEVAYHASLQNGIAKFHEGLLKSIAGIYSVALNRNLRNSDLEVNNPYSKLYGLFLELPGFFALRSRCCWSICRSGNRGGCWGQTDLQRIRLARTTRQT